MVVGRAGAGDGVVSVKIDGGGTSEVDEVDEGDGAQPLANTITSPRLNKKFGKKYGEKNNFIAITIITHIFG